MHVLSWTSNRTIRTCNNTTDKYLTCSQKLTTDITAVDLHCHRRPVRQNVVEYTGWPKKRAANLLLVSLKRRDLCDFYTLDEHFVTNTSVNLAAAVGPRGPCVRSCRRYLRHGYVLVNDSLNPHNITYRSVVPRRLLFISFTAVVITSHQSSLLYTCYRPSTRRLQFFFSYACHLP